MSRNRNGLVISIALLSSGCAMHTPERAATGFLRDLNNRAPKPEGSLAFERARITLHLEERPPKQMGNVVLRRSASWSRRNQRIELVSSNVRSDPPDRFDLRLSWSPARPLADGLLEKILGKPYGRSVSRDNGWIIHGGMLEYRVTETETPYFVFSSPAYTRDPLDFLEADNLPHLPSLESAVNYLGRNGIARSERRDDGDGFHSQTFDLPNHISITLYSRSIPGLAPYLAGMAICAADFLSVLRDVGVPMPDRLIETVSRAPDSFAVCDNFALALSKSLPDTTLTIWRRIESPRSLCEHLRPDLERCSH